jgi:hypothetical protein
VLELESAGAVAGHSFAHELSIQRQDERRNPFPVFVYRGEHSNAGLESKEVFRQ